MADSRRTAVGVFRDPQQADRAVQELRDAGFRDNQIGYVTPDRSQGGGSVESETNASGAGKGFAGGAVTGGVLGGIAGAIAAGLIPGIGPLIAGGILAGTLGGAAIGAVGGGLIGLLTGMGVPEEDARYYEGEAKSGKTLVTVQADGRYDEARSILQGAGAYDVESRGAMAGAGSQTASSQTGYEQGARTQTVPLHEEELVPEKERVQTGRARIGKEVVTEQRQVEVPVQREEVVVERQPVAAREASGEIGQGELNVPVQQEQVNLRKQPVVKEEVSLGKREVEEQRQYTDTVQREEPRVEQDDLNQ